MSDNFWPGRTPSIFWGLYPTQFFGLQYNVALHWGLPAFSELLRKLIDRTWLRLWRNYTFASSSWTNSRRTVHKAFSSWLASWLASLLRFFCFMQNPTSDVHTTSQAAMANRLPTVRHLKITSQSHSGASSILMGLITPRCAVVGIASKGWCDAPPRYTLIIVVFSRARGYTFQKDQNISMQSTFYIMIS